MTLNEFLAKGGQLLGLAEKNLTAETALAAKQIELTASAAELVTATATIATLQGEAVTNAAALATATTNLTAAQLEVTNLKATIADPKGEVAKQASAKAAAITGAQGQPALAVLPVAGPAGENDLGAQMAAITDPVKRTEFYRANEKAIKAQARK